MALRRRFAGTLFFFPAFLPLAALLPWLLTLLGGVAALAGFSLPRFWRRHRPALLACAALCLVAAGGAYWHGRPDPALRAAGSLPVAAGPVASAPPTAPAASAPAFAAFTQIWTQGTATRILSTPVVAGDMLVFGTFDNTVEALRRDTGAPAWSVPMNEAVFTVTPGPDGMVYSGEGLHHVNAAMLTALRAADGAIVWQREFFGHLEETATLDGAQARMWLGAGPGGLWALDARTGAVLWHAALGHIDAKPLLHDGVIYVPADTDEDDNRHATFFNAVDADDGTVLWRAALPGQPWGSPLATRDGGTILNTTGTGQIGVTRATDRGWAQAFAPDGTLRWQVELPGMPLQPAAFLPEQGLVIHTAKNGFITALRTADGSTAWQAQDGEYQGPAVLAAGFAVPLLAGVTYDGTLTIRNALTGAVIKRLSTGAQATASPAVAGDVLYVPAGRRITAFGGLAALAAAP